MHRTAQLVLEDVDESCVAALDEGRRIAGAERWLPSIASANEAKTISPVSEEILPQLRAALYQLALLPIKPTPAVYFFKLLNVQHELFHHLLFRAAVNQLAEQPPQDASADDSAMRDAGIKLLEQFLGSSSAIIAADLQAHAATVFAASLLNPHARTSSVLSLLGTLISRDLNNVSPVLKALVPVLIEGKATLVKSLLQLCRMHVCPRDGGSEALFTLSQHLLLRVPKKARAEIRCSAARVALDVVAIIPSVERVAFIARLAKFLSTLARNPMDVLRAVAVEAASLVVVGNAASELAADDGATSRDLLSAALAVLSGRVGDRSAAVRGKALQYLAASLTSDQDARLAPLLAELVANQGTALCEAAEERMTEGSAAVRRGAVDLLAALLGREAAAYTPAALRALLRAGLDPSLLVRKSALTAIDRVQSAHPNDVMLQQYWIALLLPRVVDPEPSVQTLLIDLLLNRVLRQPSESSLWQSLESGLCEAPEVQRFYTRAAAMLAKGGSLRRADVAAIEAMHSASDEPSPLAALSVAAVATHAPSLVDAKLALRLTCATLEQAIWERSHTYLCSLLRTVDQLHSKLSANDLRRLHSLLVPPLTSLSLPAGLVAPFITSLLALRRSNAEADKGAWATQAIEKADVEVARVALEHGQANEQTSIAVWLAGELAAQQATKIPARLTTLLQALVAADAPVSLCAAAWLALGKFALTDNRLAKKLIAPMAKELQTHSSAVVRNNVMLVLGDLAVQFPSLVDNYAPALARCVRDANETVRRQALCMLGRLVGQDYVKLRGALLLAFAVALADESETVRDTATETLEALCVTKKLAALFYHSFLQIMWQINKLSPHGGQVEAAVAFLSLPGEANAVRRQQVYEKLLGMLSDEQKLQLAARLHEEVLGATPLESAQLSLISDTLLLLQSPAAKINNRKVGGEGDSIEEEGVNGAEEALGDAKSALLGKVARKALIEAAVPILASLKRELEQLRSPLLKPLLAYFAQLASENKAEMERFLADNKQLERELQYEQRIAERSKKRRVSAVGVGAAPIVPQSPIISKSPAKLRNAPRSPRVPNKAAPLELEKEKENAAIVLSPRAPAKQWSVSLPVAQKADDPSAGEKRSADEDESSVVIPAKKARGRNPRKKNAAAV